MWDTKQSYGEWRIKDKLHWNYHIIDKKLMEKSLEEIKKIAKSTIDQFWEENIDYSRFVNRFARLNIENDVEMEKEINNEENINYRLFKDLLEIEEEGRHKGKWFNSKYLQKVGELLALYPNDRQTIIRNLKIFLLSIAAQARKSELYQC